MEFDLRGREGGGEEVQGKAQIILFSFHINWIVNTILSTSSSSSDFIDVAHILIFSKVFTEIRPCNPV